MNSVYSMKTSYETDSLCIRDLIEECKNEEEREIEENVESLYTSIELKWVIGFNADVSIANLSSQQENKLIYVTGYVPVVYDWKNDQKTILVGHLNNITCLAMSSDRKWLATSDVGDDNSLIIWDLTAHKPIKNFTLYHNYGIKCMSFSEDSKYLLTISNEPVQKTSLLYWSLNDNPIIDTVMLKEEYGKQHHISFHPLYSSYFISTGFSRVIFYQLLDHDKTIHHYSPVIKHKDFYSSLGLFNQTIYLKSPDIALTATRIGNIITWDNKYGKKINDLITPPNERRIMRFNQYSYRQIPINVITTCRDYIVTGNVEGMIDFYDTDLTLIFFFKESEIGPITNILFSLDDLNEHMDNHIIKSYPVTATLKGSPFIVPDFVVSTSTGYCGYMDIKTSNLQEIMRFHFNLKYVIASHPTFPWLCIARTDGLLRLWNYITKKVEVECILNRAEKVYCMAFDPVGIYLAIGFTGGIITILDVPSLLYTKLTKLPLNLEKSTITNLKFSDDAKYLACTDENNSVIAYRYYYISNTKKEWHRSDTKWELLGVQQIHSLPIITVIFRNIENQDYPHLISLGKDRKLIEFEFVKGKRLQMLHIYEIEQMAVPIDMIWDPLNSQYLIIANNEHKLKFFDMERHKCRRTVLAPIQKSTIKKMKIVYHKINNSGKSSSEPHLLSCTNKHIFLSILPVDGNPYKNLSIIAHPNGITNLECSFDGEYAFTVGDDSTTIFMWQLNYKILHQLAKFGGKGMTPFYNMLPGGVTGSLLKEFKDLFCYIQIRNQRKNYIDELEISYELPIIDVPDLLRAIGYFPSNYEIENMITEMKLDNEESNKICFDDIVKLYINHKPILDTTIKDLTWAFNLFSSASEFYLSRDQLIEILLKKGECLNEIEFLTALCNIKESKMTVDIASIELASKSQIEMEFKYVIEELLPVELTLSSFLEDVYGYTSVMSTVDINDENQL